MSDEQLRAAAVKRIKAKRDFWRLLGVFIIVSVILTAIWALSGGGYFWPMWAMFGMGIAALFTGWGAYGPAEVPPSQQQIDDEIRKMRGA
jgi:hypothetical protein